MNEAARSVNFIAAFARSSGDTLASVGSHRLSLVVIDQCIRDGDALDVARALGAAGRRLPFVLIGRQLTTAIIVEAMRLGAYTVLEKPLLPSQIVATIRAAALETTLPAPPMVATTATGQLAPHSIAERWAAHVLKACHADGDLRTLGAWASFAGLSYSSLCECCRLAGVQPLVARDFTRVLRAVFRTQLTGCAIEELLDISDRRTLRLLLSRAGLSARDVHQRISIEQFFASQRFVASRNAGLQVLRAVLLRR